MIKPSNRSVFARIALLLFIVFAIAACGSGGGGGTTSIQTGRFLDDPVEGLLYQTATLSGTTDNFGSFQYRDGEVVRFYVEDVLVGQAVGASSPTPFDLADTAAADRG